MSNKITTLLKLILLLATLPLVFACTTAQTRESGMDVHNIDPLEPVNRNIYAFNENMDRYLVKPVATGYAIVTPDILQTGITNFFNNLEYLNVIVNSSLQGKLDQSLSDIFRFLTNSTLGIGGLFDVATPMGLDAHNEDLGQTFAVWGTGQGAYLTLPLFGPNTVRDAPDLVSSWVLDPITYITSAISLPATALKLINKRANLLESSKMLNEAALDPYSFLREYYLQQRNYLIFDGPPPANLDEDIFGDENI